MNTSIKKINKNYPKQEAFSFREIRGTEIIEVIKSLPEYKPTVFKDIPMRVIENTVHVYSHRLTIIFNNCKRNRKLSDILKYPDIAPVFKKGDTTDKINYRSITTLSNFSKIFEKLFIAKSIHAWSLNFQNT